MTLAEIYFAGLVVVVPPVSGGVPETNVLALEEKEHQLTLSWLLKQCRNDSTVKCDLAPLDLKPEATNYLEIEFEWVAPSADRRYRMRASPLKEMPIKNNAYLDRKWIASIADIVETATLKPGCSKADAASCDGIKAVVRLGEEPEVAACEMVTLTFPTSQGRSLSHIVEVAFLDSTQSVVYEEAVAESLVVRRRDEDEHALLRVIVRERQKVDNAQVGATWSCPASVDSFGCRFQAASRCLRS